MATIFDLTENTAPDGTDRLYITDGTNDEGVQIANLLKGSGAEVPAAKITGTVAHERGGLEADVSAYDGIVQISGGSTSALSTVTHERGGLEADVSAYDGLIRISGGSTSNLKSNFSASAAPAVTDDSASGYVVGSRWIDTTNDAEYVCVDNTASAAVWVQTTGGGGGGGKVLQVLSSVYTAQVSHTSSWAATNLSQSITVSDGSSVLVLFSQACFSQGTSRGNLRLLRDSTVLRTMNGAHIHEASSFYNFLTTYSHSYLDASLSAGTYVYKTEGQESSGDFRTQGYLFTPSTITLIELAS